MKTPYLSEYGCPQWIVIWGVTSRIGTWFMKTIDLSPWKPTKTTKHFGSSHFLMAWSWFHPKMAIPPIVQALKNMRGFPPKKKKQIELMGPIPFPIYSSLLAQWHLDRINPAITHAVAELLLGSKGIWMVCSLKNVIPCHSLFYSTLCTCIYITLYECKYIQDIQVDNIS